MRALYKLILFFILISSTAAFTLPDDRTEFKKNRNLSSILQNSAKEKMCILEHCEETGGICSLNANKEFHCSCKGITEYTKGVGCEAKGKWCLIKHCKDTGGICVSTKQPRVECKCPDDRVYTKDFGCKERCEHDSDCKNGGTCTDQKTCSCPEGTEGSHCEIITNCDDLQCGNDAICFYDIGLKGGKCECKSSENVYDKDDKKCKKRCEEDSDCQHGGTCKDQKTCSCPEGTEGSLCETITNCDDLQCGNDANCVYDIGLKGGKCECKSSENVYDEDDKKCKNSCEGVICYNEGKCIVDNGKAHCECTEGFIGEKCEIHPEAECKSKIMNCFETGGTCKSLDKKNITCDCPADTNFVEKHGCKSLTSLISSGDDIVISLYINKNSTFAKGTKLDFHFGRKKETNRTRTQILLRLNSESVIPESNDRDDYDPCSHNPCENGARCEKNGSEAKCICPPGYNGKLCQYDECSFIKCQNGGKCEIKDKKSTCICQERYTGEHCEIDKCSLISCQNGGECAIQDEKAVCKCDDQYFGDFCEIDKCSMIKCLNGGRCEMRNQKASCICNDKFTGDYCEKKKF